MKSESNSEESKKRERKRKRRITNTRKGKHKKEKNKNGYGKQTKVTTKEPQRGDRRAHKIGSENDEIYLGISIAKSRTFGWYPPPRKKEIKSRLQMVPNFLTKQYGTLYFKLGSLVYLELTPKTMDTSFYMRFWVLYLLRRILGAEKKSEMHLHAYAPQCFCLDPQISSRY